MIRCYSISKFDSGYNNNFIEIFNDTPYSHAANIGVGLGVLQTSVICAVACKAQSAMCKWVQLKSVWFSRIGQGGQVQ